MRKSILTCLAALALLAAAAPPAAHAKGQSREEVAARVRKAHAEKRRLQVKFKKQVSRFNHEFTLVGRVGEVREKGFTFEPANEDDDAWLKANGLTAAVLYEDVASVHYPSKVRKFFKDLGKGAGIGAMGVGAFFIVMPVYGVQALLGDLPGC